MQENAKCKAERIEEFKALTSGAFNFALHEINSVVERLDKIGFFDAPASTKFHSAYSGGLFDHSKVVTEQLVNLTERLGLKWGGMNAVRILSVCCTIFASVTHTSMRATRTANRFISTTKKPCLTVMAKSLLYLLKKSCTAD